MKYDLFKSVCMIRQLLLVHDCVQIWVPTNPRGAERLAPGIVQAQSDFYLRRLWGIPSEVSIIILFMYAT